MLMPSPPKLSNYLWAKKYVNSQTGDFYWLPLAQHLIDTGSIAGLLYEHWLSDGQRQLLISSLQSGSPEKVKNLVEFLGAVHDLGKATPVFQIVSGTSHELDQCLLAKLSQVGFTNISDLHWCKNDNTKHARTGQMLLQKFGVNIQLATIVGAHHGMPVDQFPPECWLTSYLTRYYQSENSQSQLYRQWENLQQEIFSWALKANNFQSATDLPRVSQPAQVILWGLLVMADWIASNRDYFPLLKIDEYQVADFTSRIETGFRRWQQSQLWLPSEVIDINQVYQQRFAYQPQDWQSALAQTISQTQDPGMVIIEAPMGSGKTEAALITAEQLAAKTGRSGVFFGLPTQATSNGVFPRIKSWLENLAKSSRDTYSLRLVHGKADLNDDFRSLARGIDVDDNGDGSVIANQWFAGRKTSSLDDFVVGTVDQFLLTALKQKHLALRHLGFSKKVVIIDEVHAYDAYMGQYLQQALQWMGAYGVGVIMLSATLPAAKRKELLESYLNGKNRLTAHQSLFNVEQSLNSSAYPLITYTNDTQIEQFAPNFNEAINKSKKVAVHKINDDQLTSTVAKLINPTGVVGVIVNTVARAQKLAKLLATEFGDSMIELLHSGFIAPDRIAKEKNLLATIGKSSNTRPRQKIIVGTQVIEQSLDIDFDVLIADLAPMDLLLQRLGRVHRHAHQRSAKHHQPQLFVLGCNHDWEFAPGSVTVYGNYLLARTEYYLPKTINLPQDISPLVQKVYVQEDLPKLTAKKQSKYSNFVKQHDSKIEHKKDKATHYKIANPVFQAKLKKRDNLIGWLKNHNPNDSEENACAQVRDANETIEVIAVKKIGSGYGIFGELLDISAEIHHPAIARKLARQTLRLPSWFADTHAIIEALEKYNRSDKHLWAWQQVSWLKGSLGIIFDEQNQFHYEYLHISYDEKYGIKKVAGRLSIDE